MKTRSFLFVLALMHPALNIAAQDLSCANLINEVYTDAQIVKPNSTTNAPVKYAKPGVQILDVRYADDFAKGSTYYCNTVTDCSDGSSGLKYKVYYPNIQYSDTRKLPAIILFHSGGFSDCTNLNAADIQTYCTEFAKRGFVAFTVEYRREKEEDSINKRMSASKFLAMYRAIQDAKGAIRSIVSKELNKTMPFRIDLQNIFVGGASAGAIMAIAVAYYNSTMISQVFPNVSSYLGDINADNYSGNVSENSYTIKGVLDLWGFACVPLNFASNPAPFFSQGTKKPAFIGFHGGSDNVINFDSGYMYFASSGERFRSESLCVNGTYTLPDNGANNADLKLYGSEGLNKILKNSFKVPCELYIDCDMQHGISESTSDFGLAGGNASAVTIKQVEIYIVQRAATFFQYVMNPNFPYTLTHTKFVGCLNSRYGCNSDANVTCSNTANCTNAALQNTSGIIQHSTKENTLFMVIPINKTIRIKFFKVASTNIVLLNINGIPVKALQTRGEEVILDATNLSAGFYFLRVIQESQMQITKVVVR